MNLSYTTAKMTGFGGTLDNKTQPEQTVSCKVKEAMMSIMNFTNKVIRFNYLIKSQSRSVTCFFFIF